MKVLSFDAISSPAMTASARRAAAMTVTFALAIFCGSRVDAATYYVSNSGNNSNSCATAQSSTQTQAKKTISAGVACLAPGDTLLIHNGTYTGMANVIDNVRSAAPPSGTSWTSATTIGAVAGVNAKVIIQPPANVSGVSLNGGGFKYIIFQDFEVDNSLSDNIVMTGMYIHDVHHLRFQRIRQHHAANFGWTISVASHHIEVLDSEIYENGQPGGAPTEGHGIYSTGCDNLFAGNTIRDNQGYGMHMYNNAGSRDCPSRNVIRNNVFHGNGRHGSPAYAIVVSWGTDNLIYNNLIVGNRGGIQVYTGATNTGIYNNTIYGNNTEGIVLQYYGTGQIVRNNILFNNGGNLVDYGGSGAPTASHNLMTEPGFVNAAAGDYTLQSWSAARNAGTTVAVVKDDFAKTVRPQDGVFDIGAFEFAGSKAPKAPANVRVVTTN